MNIPQEIINKLQLLAKNNQHIELCGCIVDNRIVHIRNVSNNPNSSFIFDKKEWLSLLNSKVLVQAIWHTHPKNNPEPSSADLVSMHKLKYDYLIVTENDWRYLRCLEN